MGRVKVCRILNNVNTTIRHIASRVTELRGSKIRVEVRFVDVTLVVSGPSTSLACCFTLGRPKLMNPKMKR